MAMPGVTQTTSHLIEPRRICQMIPCMYRASPSASHHGLLFDVA